MLKRHEFLKWVCGSLLMLTTAVAPTACGGDGEDKPSIDAPTGCTVTMANVMIADNHPHGLHVLVVTPEDVAAGAEKSYMIMGAASHDHTVTITADQFTTLKGGGSVMVTSTPGTNGLDHTHVVTISC